jgi:hypothetical protein
VGRVLKSCGRRIRRVWKAASKGLVLRIDYRKNYSEYHNRDGLLCEKKNPEHATNRGYITGGSIYQHIISTIPTKDLALKFTSASSQEQPFLVPPL